MVEIKRRPSYSSKLTSMESARSIAGGGYKPPSKDRPASTTTYIIVGAISYVLAAVFLVATVAILSHFYSNSVKSTTDAVAQLNVDQNNQYAEAVAANVEKVQFYQDTLASGRPAPIDETQVIISWENGVIVRRSSSELDHMAAVAAANYVRPASAPIGQVLAPARLLGDAFPLVAIIVAPVFRFLRISVSVSGVINYLEIPRGASVMPALAARVVPATGSASASVTATDLSITPLNLSPEPIVGFSRAVPFNVTGAIELEIPSTASLATPFASFGDVIQIIPVDFHHAQIASFKLAVSGQNWGQTASPEEAPPPTLNEAEMFKLAA